MVEKGKRETDTFVGQSKGERHCSEGRGEKQEAVIFH